MIFSFARVVSFSLSLVQYVWIFFNIISTPKSYTYITGTGQHQSSFIHCWFKNYHNGNSFAPISQSINAQQQEVYVVGLVFAKVYAFN